MCRARDSCRTIAYEERTRNWKKKSKKIHGMNFWNVGGIVTIVKEKEEESGKGGLSTGETKKRKKRDKNAKGVLGEGRPWLCSEASPLDTGHAPV